MRWGSSLVTSALFATLVVLAGPSAPVRVATDPSAGNTYLCSGYSGCRSAGYSDAGYGAVNNRMYWRMYSGHNCTNYVAYRIIENGGPAERPWSGGGNASEWGLHMSRITDQTPNVGAVAWWGRYDNGSGSAGHVAYVEKVISSTEIVVSEDSWGGTFHWRRITKSSGRWPTGFIHFVDKTIRPTAKPTISGTPAVGGKLTAAPGSWSVRPSAYYYHWHVDGVSTGVLTRSYAPRPEDLGRTITVKVRAKRSGYTDGVEYSSATRSVAPGTFAMGDAPVVSGTPYVDEVLTATTGSWTPQPGFIGFRWYADGVKIPRNNKARLRLTKELVGKSITAVAVVRGEGYDEALSPAADGGKVLVGTIEVSSPFTVTGRPRYGERLRVEAGSYTPQDAAVAYQWLRDGVPLKGATAPTYRLKAADVGRKVTAQVTLTRRNYAPWTEMLPAPGVVTSPATVTLVTDDRKGKAYVRVRVRARGVWPVTGQVSIRVGGWRDTVELANGGASVRVPVSRPGRRDVVVRYLGSTSVTPAKASGSVTVR